MTTNRPRKFDITVIDNQIQWQIQDYQIFECLGILEQVKFKLLEQHSAAEAKARLSGSGIPPRPQHLTGLPSKDQPQSKAEAEPSCLDPIL